MIAITKIENLSPSHLPQISLVTGEDLGQFTQMKERFLKQIAYDPSNLTMAFFDLANSTYSEVALELESLSFFAEEKIVILDNFLDLTTAKKAYLSDVDLKQFEAYVENPVETTHLIIFAPGKLDGKRRLVKRLKRDASLFEAAPLKEQELRDYLRTYASQKGLQFEGDAFEALLVKSNFDFSDSLKNVSFLESYKKSGKIVLTDIQEAIPKTLQDNIFDLTQLVLANDVDAVRDLSRDLRLQGEDAVKLMAVMIGQFRMFLQVKLLVQQGKQESQIVDDLSELFGRRVNPYQVRFALRDASSLSLHFLQECLKALIEADYHVKKGMLDKDYLFDIALLKMMSLTGKSTSKFEISITK